MVLEDINAGEMEGERIMDKHVPWVSGIMFSLTIVVCIFNEINCNNFRSKMNEEMREFRNNRHLRVYWEDLRSYG